MPDTRTKAVVTFKEIKDLILGDKVLTDVMGYKDRIIIPAGHTLTVNDINWLKKRLPMTKPELSAEMYVIGTKAKGTLRDKAGNVVVEGSDVITEEAVAPLLKEGFVTQALPGGQSMITRPQEWPADVKWHITDINPTVKVETVTLVTDKVGDESEPAAPYRGKKRGPKPKNPDEQGV